MALLTATTPTNSGALSTGAAVAATDTISVASMGRNGCILDIINAGAGADAITISDAGVTPSGNALAAGTIAGSVTNGTAKAFRIRREQASPATGLVTVTHGQPTGVTYKLYPV